MKNFFLQNRIMTWIVVFLLVLNISVIATILFNKYHQYKIVSHPVAEMRQQVTRPGMFLKEELDLNDAQYEKFHDARMAYQKSAHEINMKLNEKKREYLNEIMEKSPDRQILQTCCDSIGFLHANLMKETGSYYNEIRLLCNDGQIIKLNAFFLEALPYENTTMMRGRGMRYGPKNGARTFRNNMN